MSVEEPTSADASYIYDSMRTCYEHDRAFNGFPTCSVYEKQHTNVNEQAGTYDEVEVAIHENAECDYEPYTEEQIANAAGLIQPGDILLVTYSFDEVNEKTMWIVFQNKKYRVTGQTREEFSGRLELNCSPMSGELS